MEEQRTTSEGRSPTTRRVTRRKLAWNFPRSIARDWFAGSPALTAMLDTFTLVIPDNEHYYVRTLRRELDNLSDPDLRRNLRAFFQQEMLHGNAHRVYWANLRDEGVDIDRFAGAVGKFLYGVVEPLLPHRFHVANVAAIEHVNAYIAHAFLARDLLAGADPAMRKLFEWHFAEEIEHKSVAFDVLATTHPGYFTRAGSAVFVFLVFHVLLVAGTTYLLLRRRQLFRRITIRDLWHFWGTQGMLGESLRAMGRYLKPSFHPWTVDDYPLADKLLQGMAWQVIAPAATDAGE